MAVERVLVAALVALSLAVHIAALPALTGASLPRNSLAEENTKVASDYFDDAMIDPLDDTVKSGEGEGDSLSLVNSADEIYSLLIGGLQSEGLGMNTMISCSDSCAASFPPHSIPNAELFSACRTGCERGMSGSMARLSAIDACPSECVSLYYHEDSSAYACLHGCTVAFDLYATAIAQAEAEAADVGAGDTAEVPEDAQVPVKLPSLPPMYEQQQQQQQQQLQEHVLQKNGLASRKMVRPPAPDFPVPVFGEDGDDATNIVIEVEQRRSHPGAVIFRFLGYFQRTEGDDVPKNSDHDNTLIESPCHHLHTNGDHIHNHDGSIVWVRFVSYWHRLPDWVSHSAAIVSFLLIALYVYYLVREALDDDEDFDEDGDNHALHRRACVVKKGSVHHTCHCGHVTYVLPMLASHASVAMDGPLGSQSDCDKTVLNSADEASFVV